jgi:hypothetical protein
MTVAPVQQDTCALTVILCLTHVFPVSIAPLVKAAWNVRPAITILITRNLLLKTVWCAPKDISAIQLVFRSSVIGLVPLPIIV